MRRLRIPLWFAVLVLVCPSVALACDYPAPLRNANTILRAALDSGGTVTIHQREGLRRAMSQVSPDTLKRTLRQDIARRDARAVDAVIDTAVALSLGRGTTLAPALRDEVMRVEQAVQSSCSGQALASGGPEDAQGAEHGVTRSEGSGGRALTFREGVTRLSITFTIYLIFLAGLLGVRRAIKERAQLANEPAAPPTEDAGLT